MAFNYSYYKMSFGLIQLSNESSYPLYLTYSLSAFLLITFSILNSDYLSLAVIVHKMFQ